MCLSSIWRYILLGLSPIAVSLIVSYGHYTAIDTSSPEIRFARGKFVFNYLCINCHTVIEGDRSLAPSLHDIGRIASGRRPQMTAPEYILESILEPGVFRAPNAVGGMPQGLLSKFSPNDVKQLVGFLATRGATVSHEEIDALTIPIGYSMRPPKEQNFSMHQVLLGESIFRGKGQCLSCHPLQQHPALTLQGPSLLAIGVLKADALRQAIEEPNTYIAREYRQTTIRRQDGLVTIGRLVQETDTGLFVIVETRTKDLVKVFVAFSDMEGFEEGDAKYAISTQSAMPSNYKNLLTADEISALIVFLKTRQGG